MTLGVAIVGYGLIGSRRSAVVAEDPSSRLVVIADTDEARTRAAAAAHGCEVTTSWSEVVGRADVDIVVVSVVTKFAAPIAVAAVASGKHVLCEKPLGRSYREALEIATAVRRSGAILKVGCNLRFHPAIEEAHRLLVAGDVGKPIVLRAIYGHGGRPGYEREWRADPDLAGGGELLDQGVHLADLSRWFLGEAKTALGATGRQFWHLGPLEDNAFAVLNMRSGAMAVFHTSWTEWRNTFSLDVFGDAGFVKVRGLGGSYGEETLVVGRRSPEGGPPSEETRSYPGDDVSWRKEWRALRDAIDTSRQPMSNAEDGLKTMELIEAIYRAASEGRSVQLANSRVAAGVAG